jgi:hypothetical protein
MTQESLTEPQSRPPLGRLAFRVGTVGHRPDHLHGAVVILRMQEDVEIRKTLFAGAPHTTSCAVERNLRGVSRDLRKTAFCKKWFSGPFPKNS